MFFETRVLLAPPQSGKKYVTLASILSHPLSRGTIVTCRFSIAHKPHIDVLLSTQHAVSQDPMQHPCIDPHYFENDFGAFLFFFGV